MKNLECRHHYKEKPSIMDAQVAISPLEYKDESKQNVGRESQY